MNLFNIFANHYLLAQYNRAKARVLETINAKNPSVKEVNVLVNEFRIAASAYASSKYLHYDTKNILTRECELMLPKKHQQAVIECYDLYNRFMNENETFLSTLLQKHKITDVIQYHHTSNKGESL